MVVITDNALRQNVFETLYDLVSNTSFSVSGVVVTAAFVDDDQSFPQVVIHPVDVEKSNRSFGLGSFDKEITIMIDVWTTKNKDKDVIADEISSAIDGFSWSGVLFVGSRESSALEPANNNKLHLKTLALTFMRKG